MKGSFKLIGCAVVALIVHLAAGAQTGVITGRVVTEDGAAMPNVPVTLSAVTSEPRATTGVRQERVVTEEDGNFKFTGLAPRVYNLGVSETKAYASQPLTASERSSGRYYRVGDHVTITLIRGCVITGKVTTSTGEPMIGVQVSVVMVKDFEGNPVRQQFGGRARSTDDRGVYRLYGLPPGTYIVLARGNMSSSLISPYDGYTPTYHPSSPPETAAEITVASGGEAAGVDIRFRGERGHTVSGVVTGRGELAQPLAGVSVTLINASTGFFAGLGFVREGEGQSGFAISGVADGEYEIIAHRTGTGDFVRMASPPRRVTVRGADAGGIELRLAPLASISGKVIVENSPNACESKRKSSLEEVIVSARSDARLTIAASQFMLMQFQPEGSVNEKGEFTIFNLYPSRYYLAARLPSESWYVRSIAAAVPAATTRGGSTAAKPAASADVARNGLAVKSGDKLTGLTVAIAGGAASLSGKIVAAKEGGRLPARLRLHLIPAEAGSADDVVRYAEAIARSDGAFALGNIAPGKYWLVARPVPDDEPSDRPLPIAWDANERAKLRREAEGSKSEVELKPCQRVVDQMIKYSAK